MLNLINILGLSLGVSVCLVIFLITSHELSYDNFHPSKERIYRIVGTTQFQDEEPRLLGYVPSPLPMRVREQITGIENVAGFYNYYAKVQVPQGLDKPKEFLPNSELPSPIVVAESSYFNIFQYEWLAGNKQTALSEPFKVVLTESATKNYFENENPESILGRVITYNDSLQVTISGVVKGWNKNTDFGFTDFISFPTVQNSFLKYNIDMESWGVWDYYSQAFIKLSPGVSTSQIETQFNQLVKDYFVGEQNSLQLQPLSDIHYNALYSDGYSRKAHLPTLYGLVGIAIFILLIAIINFINLSTAQSVRRSKEIGIRKVLGSSRFSLKMQFFSEIFILTALSIAISALMLVPILKAFQSYIPEGVIINPFDYKTWLFLGIILSVTTILAGFYPAKILSAFNPIRSLKGKAISGEHQSGWLRQSLIVFQFSISLIFIIGSIVANKQIHFMLNADMGFAKDAIINLRPGREESSEKKQLLAQRLQQIRGVNAVSLHRETPAAARHGGTSIKSIGSNGTGKEIISSFGFADALYLPLYQIKIVAGRNLAPSDTIREFVINVQTANALGFDKPEAALGQMVEVGISGKKGPIVGVVQDFHSQSFHEPIGPFFITSLTDAGQTISVKLDLGNNEEIGLNNAIASIENVWKDIFPDKPFNMTFFDEAIAGFYEKEQKTSKLINTAMGIAIFISCMGLFGLISFTTEQRKKEIGIRKVLGASITNIMLMMAKNLIFLILISLVIASPIAFYFSSQWLTDFVYRTSIDWWVFLLAGLSAVLIALFTISFHTFSAARANPVRNLSSE